MLWLTSIFLHSHFTFQLQTLPQDSLFMYWFNLIWIFGIRQFCGMKPACKVEKKCKFLKILIHMTNYNKCSLYVPILLFIYLFIYLFLTLTFGRSAEIKRQLLNQWKGKQCSWQFNSTYSQVYVSISKLWWSHLSRVLSKLVFDSTMIHKKIIRKAYILFHLSSFTSRHISISVC